MSEVKAVLKQQARQFAESTSGHGYGNIIRQKTLPFSILWLLLMLGAVAGLGYHMTLIAMQFFSFPKRVLTETQLTALRFPNVILCQSSYWSDHLLSSSSNLFIKDFHTLLLNRTEKYFKDFDNDKKESIVNKMMLDTFFDGKLDEVLNVSLPLDSYLLDCEFNGERCSAANFTRLGSDQFGFCYLFSPSVQKAVQYGGYQNGLTVTLLFEDHHDVYFTNSLRYTRGFILEVIPHDKFVNFIRLAPVVVPVGFRTDLGLSLQRTQRIQSVSDPCTEKHQVITTSGQANSYDFDTVNCVDMWLNSEIYRECGCVADLLPISQELRHKERCMELNVTRVSNGTIEIHNLDKAIDHYKCMEKEINKDSDADTYSKHIKNCMKPCKDDNLGFETAHTLLPTEKQAFRNDIEKRITTLYQKINNSATPNFLEKLLNLTMNGLLSNISLSNHVAQTHIFFKSSTLTLFQEDWQYATESFLSEAGGVIGLWMGASVLTILECMEFVTSVVVVLFRMKTSKRSNNIQVTVETGNWTIKPSILEEKAGKENIGSKVSIINLQSDVKTVS